MRDDFGVLKQRGSGVPLVFFLGGLGFREFKSLGVLGVLGV